MRLQYERYRRVGMSASVVEHTPRSLVVDLDRDVDLTLVEELLDVERSCCPFFELGWEPHLRRLTVRVGQRQYEPALDAITSALGAG